MPSFFSSGIPFIPTSAAAPSITAVGTNPGNIEYNSFAGVDIVAEIVVPGDKALTLGELQTISYSIHRENRPVRFVGHTNVMGFVRGPRTIAGSLIFTQFNSYAFYRLQSFQNDIINHNIFPLSDMLPPFDIVITFANEYGSMAKMRIFGITIVDEGGAMSIDDLITEQTMSYMARGIQPMIPMTNTLVNAGTDEIGTAFSVGAGFSQVASLPSEWGETEGGWGHGDWGRSV